MGRRKEYELRPDSLSSTIKNARERKQLTMEQLSEVSGISKNTIYRIENGLNSPSLDVLYALSSALDMKIIIR